MDWANERYVRLYTRDTTTWKLWPWQARMLFMMLLRTVDRSGVLDTGRTEPERAVAAHTDLPLDVVRDYLPELVDSGAVEIGDRSVVVPNYLEAQETPQSDAHRCREYRARRLAHKRETIRDETDTPRHAVTRRDTPSVPSVPSVPSKPKRAATRIALTTDDIQKIRESLVAARRHHGIHSQKPGKLTPDIRDMVEAPIKRGYTVADWLTVIETSKRSQKDPDKTRKHLSLSTLHLPKNFARMMEWSDGLPNGKPYTRGPDGSVTETATGRILTSSEESEIDPSQIGSTR